MSEFRKQRLLAKLFDSFQRNPYDFPEGLGADTPRTDASRADSPGTDMPLSFEATEQAIMGLAAASSNPERFAALALSLQQTSVPDLGPLLHVLQRLQRAQQQPKGAADSWAVNAGEHHLHPIEGTERANSSVRENDEELDQISWKLNQIHNKMGIQAPNIEAPAGSSPLLKIGLFKSSSELALANRPHEIQELLLVEDLLFVLLGSEGTSITYDESRNFLLDDTIDGSLIPALSPILELSSSMKQIEAFCSGCRRKPSGKVLQAFGTAVEELCMEFGQLVVALEKRFNNGGFLMSRLTFYLGPFFPKARVLFDLVSVIAEKNLQGGALLNFLEVSMARNFGNAPYHSLVERLLIPSAEPFMDCLCAWLNEGGLSGAANEFMIGANPMSDSELNAFELKTEHIPCALIGVSQKILLIGIYQSILKKSQTSASGSVVRSDLVFDQAVLHRTITGLFAEANRSMVSVLEKENGIASLLQQLKHLFFIDQLDTMAVFVDVCQRELGRPAKDADLGWLQRKLEESLGLEDTIGCLMSEQHLFDQLLGIIGSGRSSEAPKANLRGIDGFVLDYRVVFPMSLVVSKEAISKYQIIFRLLLAILNISKRLTTKLVLSKFSPELQKVLACSKQAMLQFVLNLQSYLAYQVLQPQFDVMAKNMDHANGLDRIIALHTNYLDTCLRECLLTNAKLVQLLAGVFAACEKFGLLLEALVQPGSALPAEEEIASQAGQLHQYFSKNVRVLLEALQYYSARDSDHYLGNLLTQLDFNSFYYATAYARQGSEAHSVGGLVAP